MVTFSELQRMIVPTRQTALSIWQAGVQAVEPQRLIQQSVKYDGTTIEICGRRISLDDFRQLIVIGAGKAGQSMVDGLLHQMSDGNITKRLRGWVNVPATDTKVLGSSQLETSPIVCHPARPAAINEPHPEGVKGTQEILKLISQASRDDLCLVLLSGGGSALLTAPVPEISLADKITVTRQLSQAGASINELNCVRTHLSLVKGGGLARRCGAGMMMTLILSDVIGDPIETIASGPTVIQPRNPEKALQICQKYLPDQLDPRIRQAIQNAAATDKQPHQADITNLIIGSNTLAMQSAVAKAKEYGFEVIDQGAEHQGEASDFGRKIVQDLRDMTVTVKRPCCLVYGGETTVNLTNVGSPGKGGRNQEVVLAAAIELEQYPDLANRCLILAGGTDGEDGPTDAAGGYADSNLLQAARAKSIDLLWHMKRHDAYPALKLCDSLLMTGPTGTNVMDLTIALLW